VQLDKWGSRGGGHGQLRFKVLKAAGSVVDDDLNSIPGLIQLLETQREQLGLEYYSVSPTTLDEVFLRVVGEEEEAESKKEGKKGWIARVLRR
jgi:ATP-binding cassette subfamily A (ABC1) protein 3